jgi:FAD binding domain
MANEVADVIVVGAGNAAFCAALAAREQGASVLVRVFLVFREWVVPLLAPLYWLTTGPLGPYFAPVWPGPPSATHAAHYLRSYPSLGTICA